MHSRRSASAGKYHHTQPVDRRSVKEAFCEKGTECELAPATIYRYWRWVRRLILVRRPPVHPSQLADSAVTAFVVSLQQSGLRRVSALQAIDALSFLYGEVLTRRVSLLKELRKLRKRPVRETIAQRILSWIGRYNKN